MSRKLEIFSEYNLDVKRPGTGISPMRWDEVIGKVALKKFSIEITILIMRNYIIYIKKTYTIKNIEI